MQFQEFLIMELQQRRWTPKKIKDIVSQYLTQVIDEQRQLSVFTFPLACIELVLGIY